MGLLLAVHGCWYVNTHRKLKGAGFDLGCGANVKNKTIYDLKIKLYWTDATARHWLASVNIGYK